MGGVTIGRQEVTDDQVRHMHQRVRRLKPVAKMVLSVATFTSPLNTNRRVSVCSFSMPKTSWVREDRYFRASFAWRVGIRLR